MSQDAAGGLLNRRDLRRILAGGLEQDVGHFNSVRHAVIAQVLVVIMAQVLIRHMNHRANAVGVDQHVTDAALLGQFVAFRNLLEKSLERLGRHRHRLDELRGVKDGVADSGLLVPAEKLRVDCLRRQRDAVRNNVLKLLDQKLLTELL